MTDQNRSAIPTGDEQGTNPSPFSRTRGSRSLKAAGLVAAGVIAGGTLAATMSAVAAPNASPNPTATSDSTASGSASGTAPTTGNPPQGMHGPGGPGGPAPMRSDETALTGTILAKAKAAALKAVSGGTVVRAETDAGDAEYEVHMTKADGTPVTVKLDKNFAVTAVEDGKGKGDPKTAGPQGQAPTGEAPATQGGYSNGA